MIIPKESEYIENIPGHNRFDMPDGVVRVTGGNGGEAFLILGSEKTAIYDTGMACFKNNLISNIHEVLDPLNRKLDYIFISHTHYDHMGALPYLIEEYPNVKVCAAPKATRVFSSETAKNTITDLGEKARKLYNIDDVVIKADPLRVDIELTDGMEISLGKETVVAYEAKGHTDCSLCYMIQPDKIFFTNESVGIQETNDYISCSPLKSFEECLKTTKRFAQFDIDTLIMMHYGSLPKWYIPEFFRRYQDELIWEEGLIRRCIKNGMTDQEVSDEFDKFCWNERRELNHPYPAYHLNTMIIIERVRREMQI